MNERIKELLLQAEIKITTQCPVTGQDYSYHEFSKEKFAELIVKECASLAFDGPNGILEHFGVEE